MFENLKTALWYKSHGMRRTFRVSNIHNLPVWDRAWDWEDGGGISVLTHNATVAEAWVAESMEANLGPGWREEYYDFVDEADRPAFSKEWFWKHGETAWVAPRMLEDDTQHWKTHKYWWFGRIPIMTASY